MNIYLIGLGSLNKGPSCSSSCRPLNSLTKHSFMLIFYSNFESSFFSCVLANLLMSVVEVMLMLNVDNITSMYAFISS